MSDLDSAPCLRVVYQLLMTGERGGRERKERERVGGGQRERHFNKNDCKGLTLYGPLVYKTYVYIHI